MNNPTKPMTVAELAKHSSLDAVVFESLDQMLYRLLIKAKGQWYYVACDGKSLLAHNQAELQRLLVGKQIGQVQLQQRSAYDEMIGHPPRSEDNLLVVPFGVKLEGENHE